MGGAGGVGFQVNLPVSIPPHPRLALHANAGPTCTPAARNALGEAHTFNANPGGSAIWLVRPGFNFLVELLWFSTEHDAAPETGDRQEAGLVDPGARWAFNFPSGLQIVPGVGLHARRSATATGGTACSSI